jgi:predicted nucleic acid-binding protein
VGGAAARVFTDSHLEVVTTEEVLVEVRQHLAGLAEKMDVLREEAEEYLSKLPLRAYPEIVYRARMGEARRHLADRDPDDVGLAALALHLGIPVWSNDKDFRVAPVELYPTAKLLKVLGL